jgi:MFS family permease
MCQLMSQTENSRSPSPARAEGLSAKPALIFLAIMVAVMAMRMPLLNVPLDRDEGACAYIGWRMGLHEIPYRDWMDQKPPGIFWVYRLALALPWEPVRAIHLVGALFAAVSAGVLFLLARRFLEPFWAVVAAVLLGLLSADPTAQGNAANTELFMQLPFLLSLLAFLGATTGSHHRRRLMVLCGALAGLAALFKQAAALYWVLLVALYPIFCEKKERRRRKTLAFAAWTAAGAVVVWGVVMAWFLSQHAGPEFVHSVLFHNLDYIGTVSPADRLAHFKEAVASLFKSQAIIWLLAFFGSVVLLQRRQRKWFMFLMLWLMTSAVGVNASGFFLPHYFQSLLAPLSLAAAFGAAGLEKARGWARAPGWLRRAVLTGGLALLPAVAMFPFLFRYTAGEAASRIYPGMPFAVMPGLGQRLAEVTRPEDRVFVFGSEPELLFYAKRASATRYLFLSQLFGPFEDALEKQVAVSLEIAKARPAAAFYLPDDIFFVPHIEHYLAGWGFDYVHRSFQADRWLELDAAGSYRVLPAIKDAETPTNIVGKLFVRKAAP